MTDVLDRAKAWMAADPDPGTRGEIEALIEAGDVESLEALMGEPLNFGTAGIRGRVGPGPARMNRAVVIRTTYGLARYLSDHDLGGGLVVVGFDARPTSRSFAEDTVGVLAAAGFGVVFFPEVTPTPLVAFAAKHLAAVAAVMVTASHNPPEDNGYKVYGPDAAQIVSPVDVEIQELIETAPPAGDIPRIEDALTTKPANVSTVPGDILDRYWDELSSHRSRTTGSTLEIVYTPIHGCGLDTLSDMMARAGHLGLIAVPEQARPDGSFPTVRFPNPEEPGAMDLALALAMELEADLVLANDPDADRLAVVVPRGDTWRALSGNEIGALLGEYVLSNDPDPASAIVASSVVSSPLMERIAAAHGATHETTLTGFKWIVRAGRALEQRGRGRFVFGYEEALGFTVGSIVRDKDGISAAIVFTDMVADLHDAGMSPLDRLYGLWGRHGVWVGSQLSIVMSGSANMKAAVERISAEPPQRLGGHEVEGLTDYRQGAETRPPWLGAQDLVELSLGDAGRVLVRPSGTEPKLKVYVDLTEVLRPPAEKHHSELQQQADDLAQELGRRLEP